MRQGQQNRRGRGRNNNSNRKGGHHNPLSRSFESNGPNERIRGTPSHIAEKYSSLAREAQSTGDPVLAENYLQHAEHYSRIIMAYREQLNPGGDGMNGGGHRMRAPGDLGEPFDDTGEEHGHEPTAEENFPQPAPPPAPAHQQSRPPAGEQGRHDRPFRRDQNRPRFHDRGERHGNADRDRQAEGRPEPQDRTQEQPADGGDPRRRDRFQQTHEQPEFLRRPVRRARSDNGEPGKGEPSQD